ncbi:MFS transporter [Thermocatellispora tengchongensis]|uniref:MFS transporter n=1 Tax=Thermocatellispora tengchongensis TaxID=1073253 RepID=UPI0033738B5D
MRGREVTDWRGRVYLTDVTPEQILNRPRSAMLWPAGAAMGAIGVLQYGYGAALPVVAAARGWGITQALWLLAGWALCQAAVGLPTAAAMERRGARPRATLLAGAALCAAGLLALAHLSDPLWAFAGYSLLGGFGGGLVYATCSSVVARWYPERSAARVSQVTGAFAYGAVPFVVAAHLAGPGSVTAVLDVAAVAVGAVVAVAALLLRLPPARWWPAHIDPRAWALDGRVNPALRCNPRAVREFSAGEALRTPALFTMSAILVLAGAVSLFNVAVVATLASAHGVAATVAAAAGLIALNGAGRAASVALSERIGRRAALTLVLASLAIGQAALAGALAGGSGVTLAAFVLFAGLGGGGFYPLIAGLVREYFGEARTAEIHGVIYAAKGIGGLLGAGMATVSLAASASPAACWAAAAMAAVTIALARRLRQPGRPNTLPITHAARP